MKLPRARRTVVRSPNWIVATVAGTTVAMMISGCASPGPPLPPTLNLPERPPANSLSAERVGPVVIVRWTMPERTTDRLLIKGPVEAEVCRRVVKEGETATAEIEDKAGARGAVVADATTSRTTTAPCSPVVAKTQISPGAEGEVTDVLPAELVTGAPRRIEYRVQLKNHAERTAGASTAVFAVAGSVPAAVTNFHARAAKAGVVLGWSAERGPDGSTVEFERTTVESSPNVAAAPQQDRARAAPAGLFTSKEPAVLKLKAGDADVDSGGTIDRSAELGRTYSYIAWRVRTVMIGGQPLELRSSASQAVSVKMEDIFAPEAPAGLVAAPGFAGEGSAARPVIDLSWEASAEPRIAGYRVYGRDSGEWKLISGTELVKTAAFRDANAATGNRYAYRVTAVGENGMESDPGAVAEETAP